MHIAMNPIQYFISAYYFFFVNLCDLLNKVKGSLWLCDTIPKSFTKNTKAHKGIPDMILYNHFGILILCAALHTSPDLIRKMSVFPGLAIKLSW